MPNAPHKDAPGLPVALSPESIDRELASMWKQRAEEGGAEPQGVTRVALGNVIWLTSRRHRAHARHVFARLVPNYPCRLILLEYHEDREDPDVDAFVNAQCFRSPDLKGEVCCEEIVLRFGAAGFEHVDNAVLSLLLPDLPTTFVYISALPRRYDSLVRSIRAIADHTLTEATLMEDPVEGLRGMAKPGACAGTLSWFRLTPLREQVAAVFDDPSCGALLRSIRTLRVKWCGSGGAEALTSASLLAGWLASRLGWKPHAPGWPYHYDSPAGTVAVEFLHCHPEESEDATALVEIEFLCATGDRVRLIRSDKHGALERVIEGPSGACPGRPMFVKAGVVDEAQALLLSLNTPTNNPVFGAAAALAVPVLESALERMRA